jgi:hypothetical protein
LRSAQFVVDVGEIWAAPPEVDHGAFDELLKIYAEDVAQLPEFGDVDGHMTVLPGPHGDLFTLWGQRFGDVRPGQPLGRAGDAQLSAEPRGERGVDVRVHPGLADATGWWVVPACGHGVPRDLWSTLLVLRDSAGVVRR